MTEYDKEFGETKARTEANEKSISLLHDGLSNINQKLDSVRDKLEKSFDDSTEKILDKLDTKLKDKADVEKVDALKLQIELVEKNILNEMRNNEMKTEAEIEDVNKKVGSLEGTRLAWTTRTKTLAALGAFFYGIFNLVIGVVIVKLIDNIWK